MERMESSGIFLSVVVPFYNEKDNLVGLAREIERALAEASFAWEMIFVDDGSEDGGRDVLLAELGDRPNLRIVVLDGNFGQSDAMYAGIEAARGCVVATLDADGQNDPADIPRLLDTMRETGADMVCGYRARRRDGFVKRLSSRIANSVRRAICPDPVRDTGCSLKVFKRECIVGGPFFHGAHRFMATLAQMRGFKVCEAPVSHRPREHGVSKYGVLDRLCRTVPDLLGMRWLVSRRLRYRVGAILEGGGEERRGRRGN